MTAHPIPIRLLCAALVVGLLGGCDQTPRSEAEKESICWEECARIVDGYVCTRRQVIWGHTIFYTIHEAGIVKTPRLSSEGKPMCGPVASVK